MIRSQLIISLMVIWGFSGSASAEPRLAPGVSGYSSAPIEGSDQIFWAFVRSTSHCFVRTKTEKAEAFLATGIDTRAESRAFKSLFSNRRRTACMQNIVKAKFQRAYFRGAIAEELFHRRIKEWPRDAKPKLTKQKAGAGIHGFAECYVAKNFTATRRLLENTKLATKGEMAFIQEMQPDFADCLPKRRQIVLSAIDIRMALAEAAYKAVLATENTETLATGDI